MKPTVNAFGRTIENLSRQLRGSRRLPLSNGRIATHLRARRRAGMGVGCFPVGAAGDARECGFDTESALVPVFSS